MISQRYPAIPKCNVAHANKADRNVVQHWGFFEEDEIVNANGKLLMLDVDLGRRCSLRCPSCFRKRNAADDTGARDLEYQELLDVIDDARDLGLKSIKICGAGEPLENPNLLRFARDLTARGVGLAFFTKGHVLGDDSKVSHVFGHLGIHDANALARELLGLKTSILLSLQSTSHEVQDRLVGGMQGYTHKRNQALEILAQAGFNKTQPTRLAVCTNPISKLNFHEIYDIYCYARERNILPVIAALMVSGRQIDDEFLRNNDVSDEEKEDLFVRVYNYNLHEGIQTIDEIGKEGISCLPGIHPCNQIAVGLYLTSNGNVLRCPGDSGKPLGNVQEIGIAEIWRTHRDWKLSGHFNCYCPFKDGITLPEGIYQRVLDKLTAIST